MTNQNNHPVVPTWVLAYTAFLILLGFGAGALALFAPGNIFQNVKIDYGQITAITAMFAACNVALGTIAAYGLWKRDPKYLLMVSLARFVVELLDLMITVFTNLISISPVLIIVVWTAVFLAPQIQGIRVLNRLANAKA